MLQTHSNSLSHHDNVIFAHPRSEVCSEILDGVKRAGVQPLLPPEDRPQCYRQLRQERLGSEELKHLLCVLVARCKTSKGDGLSCQVTNSNRSGGPGFACLKITKRSRKGPALHIGYLAHLQARLRVTI